MESSDSRALLDDRESPEAPEVPPAASGEPRSRPVVQTWTLILGAALAAGLVSWAGIEATNGFFKPRLFPIRLVDGSITYEPSLATKMSADRKNAALAFAIQGGVLALSLGLAGGLAGRSPGRGLAVGLGAQVAGAVGGAMAARLLFPIIYRQHVPDPNDLLTPMLVQAGIWIAIGAVGGPALGIALGARRRVYDALWGAILGAFLAAVVYRVLNGVFSPASGPTVLVALDSSSRALAAFCLTTLVAVGAARGALGQVHLGAASREKATDLGTLA